MNLEGFIPLAAGVYSTLLGFGVVTVGKDPERHAAWMKRFGTFMKIGGPLLIVFGVVQLLGLLG